MNAVTPFSHSREVSIPVDELETAKDFARAEKAASTRRAYRSDFDSFRAWCEARNLSALPAAPQAVAAYLGSEASRGHQAIEHQPPRCSHPLRSQARRLR